MSRDYDDLVHRLWFDRMWDTTPPFSLYVTRRLSHRREQVVWHTIWFELISDLHSAKHRADCSQQGDDYTAAASICVKRKPIYVFQALTLMWGFDEDPGTHIYTIEDKARKYFRRIVTDALFEHVRDDTHLAPICRATLISFANAMHYPQRHEEWSSQVEYLIREEVFAQS